MQTSSSEEVLAIRDLGVVYGGAQAVDGVSLSVHRGEVVGVVGESGSGKSTVLNAVAGLLPRTAEVRSGSIRCGGIDVLRAGDKEKRALRGKTIGCLFQNAEGSFDPLFTVGSQFDEALRSNGVARKGKRERLAIMREALERVGLDDADRVLKALPSELSGGMCQRAALAIALAQNPGILLADEPTSALDVRSQEKVVGILERLNHEDGLSVLMVSHDIDLVASFAHRVVVMRDGRVVESGPSGKVMADPQHPYTRELIAAIPRATSEMRITELGGRHAS
ncbi:MAG: ABC transporter ATP-binding protein [Coriobacteriales bacterium]